MKKPLLLFIICLSVVKVYGQLPTAAEYRALIQLYNSTNGQNWTNNTGWSTANPNVVQSVSSWYGVQTDANGHVTTIDMDGVADFTFNDIYTGNNLEGTIPPSIGDLAYLQVLVLGGNKLSGSIPQHVGKLTNLLWFIASYNQLSGSLPDSIGYMVMLDKLVIEHNQLTGSIPSSIGNLMHLWGCRLSDNQLSGSIPASIGSLTNLRYFHLHNNNLSGAIPTEIGNMTNLWQISFSNNNLSGSIPSTLGNLKFLFGVFLNNNALTGSIAPSLAGMDNLIYFDISNNSVNGNIPSAIGSIHGVASINVHNNTFTFSDLIGIKGTFPNTVVGTQRFGGNDEAFGVTVGTPFTLTTSVDRNTAPASTYQWFRVNSNAPPSALNTNSTTGHTVTVSDFSGMSTTTNFYYTISNSAIPELQLVSKFYSATLGQAEQNFAAVNYIRTIEVQKEGKMNLADVESATVPERLINYTYLDGLGRPIQTVQQQQTPLQKDLVQPIVYDEFGRESRKYLPFAMGTSGQFKTPGNFIFAGEYVGSARGFYSSGSTVANDSRAWSDIEFEPSSLNRPLKEYGPGREWASEGGANKFVHRQYLTNVHGLSENLTEEKVIAWAISAGALIKRSPIANNIESGGYYSSGQVTISVTTDENGNAVREYTNKEGQVILKKVQVVENATSLNDPTKWASTYYIYDDLGNLTVVLPPEGVKQFLLLGN